MTSFTPRKLLLASASPARLATLRAAGVNPQVQVSTVDEPALLARTGTTDPEKVALLLAQAKAEDVAATIDNPGPSRSNTDDVAATLARTVPPKSNWSDLLVLGCDSVLDLDGVALGKPENAADAVRRWQQMRGRSGVLRTGHWLIDLAADSKSAGGTSSTTVHFADVSDAEIVAYVATGEPLYVAGAFTIDGFGGAFVTGIEGDHHGVVGVSLPLLRTLVASLGVAWPALWTNETA